MTIENIIKQCKDALNKISVEDLRKEISGIKENNTICYYHTLFTDYNNRRFMLAIGYYDEDYVALKYGIIDSNSMLIDYSDILLPYYYEGNDNYTQVLDTEYLISDNIKDTEIELIKNDCEDVIEECIQRNIFTI